MRAYGKPRGTVEPVELAEVTIVANPDVLRSLAQFITDCAEQMERGNRLKFSHDHFLGHHPRLGRRTPDFIVGDPKVSQ
jgi:hypothetical protein